MQKCLITGSQGFIGRYFVQRLRQMDYDPVPADDLLLKNAQGQRFEEFGPLRVFHFAGAVGVVESWAEPSRFIESNVLGTSRVLEFCSRTGSQLTFLSSPIERSDEVPLVATATSSNPYLFSKRLAEQLCKFFEDSYGLNVVLLRLFNVYGPGQSVRFLIPQLIKQLIDHDQVSVQNLWSVRDYIYIDDIVEVLTRVLAERANFSGVFDVGTEIGTSVHSIIEELGAIHSRPFKVECQESEVPERLPRSIANIDATKSALNWEPKVSLREGLERTYRFFRKGQSHFSG